MGLERILDLTKAEFTHEWFLRSGMELQPCVNQFSHCETRFGIFILRGVFTPGLATQNFKFRCINALTQKFDRMMLW